MSNAADRENIRSAETEIMLAAQGHQPYLSFIQRDLQGLASKNMLNEALDQMRADAKTDMEVVSNIKPTITDGKVTAIDFTAANGNKIHSDAAHQWACSLDTTLGSDVVHALTGVEYAQKGTGWEFYQQSLQSSLQEFQAKGVLPEALKRMKEDGMGAIKSATATEEGGKLTAVDIETATGNKLHFDVTKQWAFKLDTTLGTDILHTATDLDLARQFPEAYATYLQNDLRAFAQKGLLPQAIERMQSDWSLASHFGGVRPHFVDGKIASLDFVGGPKTVHCDGTNGWAVTLENSKPSI